MAIEESELEKDWRVLGFDLALCSHYHQERRRFFERWNRATAFFGVIMGTATVSSLLGKLPDYAVAASVAVTIVQGLNLVIGFSRLAWLHGDFYRRFIDLEMKWRETQRSKAALNSLTNERRKIEQGEPPCLPYLVRRCQIELMRRDGYSMSEAPRLTLPQRFFAQYLPTLSYTSPH
ncbi:MAG: hypothetical protein QM741_10850 [Rudaea sp.]|uniref:hypothetical protein n=1 Tax=Rudaea sp. TaxID=2136325 RepID=UPI0039E2740B